MRFCFILALMLSCQIVFAQPEKLLAIIPQPVFCEINPGQFEFSSNLRILLNGDSQVNGIAMYFADFLKSATTFNVPIDIVRSASPVIKYLVLEINDTATWCEKEGYHIIVEPKQIRLIAASPAGLFYAMQSLRQLMPAGFEQKNSLTLSDIKIPCMRIADKPRFAWRGMNLDCGRHFMDKDFVKRYIDLLAYHKMNVLHWHLTEDQGWRIEIKKYPLLTSIGAWRTEDDGSVYGGFYTQEDIREIVAYAAERFVTVVPEIELPGHSLAALAAYPQFSCSGGPFQVEKRWGVFKDIYCAGNDSTFLFIQDVLTEVMALFPSKFIHIGGDEAPKYRWENCPKCQARMKAEGLKNEMELQSYFIQRIEKFLNAHGRNLIGWDEILEGGMAPSATVQSWRGFDGAIEAANHGHNAIVSPTSHCYFDYDVAVTSLEKVYSFEPIPEGLDSNNHHHIIGGECNMWTEYTPQEVVDSKVFPRICAMAEVLWTPLAERDFKDFHKRMSTHYQRLDALGVTYGYEREAVIVNIQYVPKKGVFITTIEAGQPDIELHFTIDGTLPSILSPKYVGEFMIDGSAELQVIPLRKTKGSQFVVSRKVVMHKALAKAYSLKNPYSNSYKAGGDSALTDGLRGTGGFRDNLWQGYNGTDFEAIIDLGQVETVSKVTTGFLQSTLSWIFYPPSMQVFVSENGIDWQCVGAVSNTVPQTDAAITTKDFVLAFNSVSARYIKVLATSIYTCPDWHPGAGGKTWLFVDEIIVE